MRELSLIKILNGSIDALYYEMSYENSRQDIVPPITSSMYSMFSPSECESREKSRLSSAQVLLYSFMTYLS